MLNDGHIDGVIVGVVVWQYIPCVPIISVISFFATTLSTTIAAPKAPKILPKKLLRFILFLFYSVKFSCERSSRPAICPLYILVYLVGNLCGDGNHIRCNGNKF